jgi:hypothetical protein
VENQSLSAGSPRKFPVLFPKNMSFRPDTNYGELRFKKFLLWAEATGDGKKPNFKIQLNPGKSNQIRPLKSVRGLGDLLPSPQHR